MSERRAGRRQFIYDELFRQLVDLGCYQAFAGIALPNEASIGLHESVGFQPLGVYRKVGFKHGAWRAWVGGRREFTRPVQSRTRRALGSAAARF